MKPRRIEIGTSDGHPRAHPPHRRGTARRNLRRSPSQAATVRPNMFPVAANDIVRRPPVAMVMAASANAAAFSLTIRAVFRVRAAPESYAREPHGNHTCASSASIMASVENFHQGANIGPPTSGERATEWTTQRAKARSTHQTNVARFRSRLTNHIVRVVR